MLIKTIIGSLLILTANPSIPSIPKIPGLPGTPAPRSPDEVGPLGWDRPGGCITQDIVNETAKKEGEKIYWLKTGPSITLIRTMAAFARAKMSEDPPKLPFADSVALVGGVDGKQFVALFFNENVSCDLIPLKEETANHLIAMSGATIPAPVHADDESNDGD